MAWKLFAVACLVAGLDGRAGGHELSNWRADCVGRMQISLPGDVEVAAKLPKDLLKGISGIRNDQPPKFEDGQRASWSSSTSLKISHPISDDEKKAFAAAIDQEGQRIKDWLKAEDGGRFPLVDLPRTESVISGWHGKDFYVAFFYLGRTVIQWEVGIRSDDQNGVAKASAYYQTLLTGLRSRRTFDVPKEPGVCLPYAFVRDDGKDSRHVGMTYRLKAHPDITIWLQDGNAAKLGENQNPAKFTAEYDAAFFWEQDYQNRRSFKSLWPGHYAFQPTTLAGQKGVKTFVELTRLDGETRDYGFLVAVRGDPDAKEDTPDLMLYVIQDSINARKLGIEPMSKAAFLDMAESIAASVKRRPVEGQ